MEAEKIKKQQMILLVSVGAGAVEGAMAAAFPEYEVRSVSTGRAHGRQTEQKGSEPLEAAFRRAIAEGVAVLVIQPMHLVNGCEYARLSAIRNTFASQFSHAVLAQPLLAERGDIRTVAAVLAKELVPYCDGKTAVCYLAHGTEKGSNAPYHELQSCLEKDGHTNFYIGVLRGEPSFETVLQKLKEDGAKKEGGAYERVILAPLMVSVGRHARYDMAGENAGSWRTRLEAEGFSVKCVLKGLAEIEQIQKLYIAHTQAVLDCLNSSASLKNE